MSRLPTASPQLIDRLHQRLGPGSVYKSIRGKATCPNARRS